MIPDKRVVENIKKLIGLGMSDKDIENQLSKMGVNKEDAKELLSIAKNKNSKSQEITEKEDLLPKDLFKDDDIKDIKIKDAKESKVEEPKEKTKDVDVTSGIDVSELEKYIKDDDEELTEEDITTQINEDNEYEDKTTEENNNDKIDENKNISKEKENLKKQKKEYSTIDYTINDKNSNIWQSGILTTINTKMSELDDKEKEIENNLYQKINNEIKKYKQVQDTTKNLLLNKISEQIAEQKQEFTTNITKQLAQIKIEQAKINKTISEINSGKKEIEEKIVEFDNIKEKTTTDTQKLQNEIKKVAAIATVKINQKTKQINEILTLQSKISQGLIKNTKKAIDEEITELKDLKERVKSKIDPQRYEEKLKQMDTDREEFSKKYDSKFDDIKEEFLKKANVAFKEKTQKIDEYITNLKTQVNPKQIYDKLEELEKFKEQLAKRYDERFNVIKNKIIKESKQIVSKKTDEELENLKKIKEEIVNKTDPEIITKKLEELEVFEKTLIESVDEKISQSSKIYESSISQQFKEKIKLIDEQIEKINNLFVKLDLAKETINELNGFKDQFIKIIDKNIEKMNQTMGVLEKKIKEIEK
jgi:hypothetical protein